MHIASYIPFSYCKFLNPLFHQVFAKLHRASEKMVHVLHENHACIHYSLSSQLIIIYFSHLNHGKGRLSAHTVHLQVESKAVPIAPHLVSSLVLLSVFCLILLPIQLRCGKLYIRDINYGSGVNTQSYIVIY